MFNSFSVANNNSTSSARVSSRNSYINASNDENCDHNDAINENSSNDSSDENYTIRRSFQFPHDGSLANE